MCVISKEWDSINVSENKTLGQMAQEIRDSVYQKDGKRLTNICPPYEDVFKAFQFDACNPNNVKVVIIGQDPYPDSEKAIANGLSFSSSGNKKPHSIGCIFGELIKEGLWEKEDKPNHRCLIPWARKGVLLLNTALTVEKNNAGSHLDIWKGFITSVIEYLKKNSGCIFVAWGVEAQKILKDCKVCPNRIIKGPHPSVGQFQTEGINNEYGGYFKAINKKLVIEENWLIDCSGCHFDNEKCLKNE